MAVLLFHSLSLSSSFCVANDRTVVTRISCSSETQERGCNTPTLIPLTSGGFWCKYPPLFLWVRRTHAAVKSESGGDMRVAAGRGRSGQEKRNIRRGERIGTWNSGEEMDSETGVQFFEKMMPCYMVHVTLSPRLEWMHEWHEKIVVGRTSFSGLEGHVCLFICMSMFHDRKADEEKEMSKCDPSFLLIAESTSLWIIILMLYRETWKR